MNPNSTILTEAEIEDFKRTILQYRYDKDDFQLTEIPAHEQTGKQQNTHFLGEVSVRRISNGNEITYKAGRSAAKIPPAYWRDRPFPWPAYFQDDLKHGTFGHH
ncbi:hypothetical protein ACFL9T_10590 [Thermodesulfobacteriota bacterium]